MSRLALVGVAILTSSTALGCTFSAGEPYGLVSATMEARYELRADRDVGDEGWQKLSNEMHLQLAEARLVVDVVELIAPGTDALGAVFDPANPPPGYSLCHNGHCHSAGGDLVDYEDIEAELAGGVATSSTALVLRSGTQDLLSDEPLVLDCGPSGGDEAADCQLGPGRVSLVRATASRLEVTGLVRDGLAQPRFDGERPFEGTVLLVPTADDETTPGALEAAVDLPLDDDNPSAIALRLSLVTNAALFDGIDPDAVAMSSETFALNDDPTIRAAFSELSLGVEIHRGDP